MAVVPLEADQRRGATYKDEGQNQPTGQLSVLFRFFYFHRVGRRFRSPPAFCGKRFLPPDERPSAACGPRKIRTACDSFSRVPIYLLCSAATSFCISSGEMSSMCVAKDHEWPNGSSNVAMRSP